MKSDALSHRDIIRKELRGICQSVPQVAFCTFHDPKGAAILIEPEIHEDLKHLRFRPSTDAYVRRFSICLEASRLLLSCSHSSIWQSQPSGFVFALVSARYGGELDAATKLDRDEVPTLG